MNTFSLIFAAATIMFAVWFVWRITSMIKADGYGFRSASGLPRDWAPPETQSTSYAVKPHF